MSEEMLCCDMHFLSYLDFVFILFMPDAILTPGFFLLGMELFLGRYIPSIHQHSSFYNLPPIWDLEMHPQFMRRGYEGLARKLGTLVSPHAQVHDSICGHNRDPVYPHQQGRVTFCKSLDEYNDVI